MITEKKRECVYKVDIAKNVENCSNGLNYSKYKKQETNIEQDLRYLLSRQGHLGSRDNFLELVNI